MGKLSELLRDLFGVFWVAVKLGKRAVRRLGIDPQKIGPVIKRFHGGPDIVQRQLRFDAQVVVSVSLHALILSRLREKLAYLKS